MDDMTAGMMPAERLLHMIFNGEVGTCHRCDKPIDSNAHGEREFELNITATGGYMSFRDDMVEEPAVAIVCHDCAVEFYRWMNFDPAAMKDMRGLHPDRNDGNPGEPMCCEFAWRALPGFADPDHDGPTVEHGYEVAQ